MSEMTKMWHSQYGVLGIYDSHLVWMSRAFKCSKVNPTGWFLETWRETHCCLLSEGNWPFHKLSTVSKAVLCSLGHYPSGESSGLLVSLVVLLKRLLGSKVYTENYGVVQAYSHLIMNLTALPHHPQIILGMFMLLELLPEGIYALSM